MYFELSVTINRPPFVVFAFLRDKDKFPQKTGSPALVLEQTTPGPPGVGTRYREVVQMLPFYRGEILSQITRFEPGEHLEEDFQGAGLEGHLAYQFLPVGDGTKLVQRETVRYRGLLRPFGRIFNSMLSRRCLERLHDIKAILERNPATFYLVRHAHAEWTLDEDRPLSARGRVDAERVADTLQAHPITHIYASPYRRATESVEPLAARLDLPIHELPALRERQLATGRVDDFAGAVEATWRDPSFAHPGGESNAAAQERGVAAILALQEQVPAGHIVLGTHGNLLTLVLQHFYPAADFAFWRALTMPDIYRLSFTQSGKAVVHRLWNEVDVI